MKDTAVNSAKKRKRKVKLTSFFIFFFKNFFSYKIIKPANKVNIIPWPASPNMIANKNGNVIIVYKAATKYCSINRS